ncbi:pyruvate carboxyltransferase [Streptomyces fagopyri]|uniref:2-isopropylmalate synthase n=1 Tax=Streptomyces fagopyri TaxID=2662397 RepID=A0A5Q0L710_9ACTN|nr:pyruvate carboxyltransferase [Streptomyces fagopyri]QFZ72347.1 pyruvate carboxyltransferase [Streptomyces fagopyri]
MRRIRIFDATLRDGEQAPGNAMSPQQKLALALKLEELGVDTVETGYPGSSAADFEATRLIAKSLTTAGFATFNRCSREDIRLSMEAAGGNPRHQVQVCCTGSDIHLRHKRGITRAQALSEVDDSVRYARSLGAVDINLAVEDASRGEHEWIRALVGTAVEAGATAVTLADTTGFAIPQEFGELIAAVRACVPRDIVLATHCHDDLGLSLANALAGLAAGADEVQATLAGIGERSGNTSLEELAAVLSYKGTELGMDTGVRTELLDEAFELLSGAISLERPRNKAIFGTNSFATQAGIHQAAMLQNPVTYEFIRPESFGRQRALLVGRHSGRSILRHLLGQLGIPADDGLVSELYEEYIANRPNGDCDELDVLRDRLADRLGVPRTAGATA